LSILGTIGAVGAVAGAGIGAVGANAAANTQAGAAGNAAQLQATEAQNALNFQKQEFSTNQANIAPYLQAGQGAIGTLSNLTSTPGQGLLTPWTQQFQAPTATQAAAQPGYQFALQQGTNALQNSAASSGNLLSGNEAAAQQQYGQQLGQEDYQQVYNNALTQYQQSYNQFQQNQSNTYNRLAGVAGTGQVAAGQLSSAGQAAANNVGNISLTTGAQQGQDIQNAGAATASGYASLANLLGGGASSATGSIEQSLLLQQLLAGQGGGNGVTNSIAAG